MGLKLTLGKSVELGVVVVTVATLGLVGCGGGGSSGGAVVNTTGTGLACAATGRLIGTAAVDCWLSDSIAGGVGTLTPFATATAATPAPLVSLQIATAQGAGVYAGADVFKEFRNNTWNTLVAIYNSFLSSGGWTTFTANLSVTNNNNGTASTNRNGLVRSYQNFVRTDLAGTTIPCINSLGLAATCSVPGNFPAGASLYTVTEVSTGDEFGMSSGLAPVTNASGVALTVLPTITSAFCVSTSTTTASYLQPIASAVAGADNYSSFNFFGTCNASSITTATSGVTAQGTLLISNKATSMPSNPTVLLATVPTNPANVMNNKIIAVKAGAVYVGTYKPIGTQTNLTRLNKVAINAGLQAHGFSPLP